MPHRIHDDEPDTSEATVRSLLANECPQWADQPLEYLQTSGTDNAMWRVRVDHAADVIVRLPRRPGAAEKIAAEAALLEQLRSSDLGTVVATPEVRHVGQPTDRHPHQWSVLGWLDGTDAWSARAALGESPLRLAEDLGAAVLAIRALTGVVAAPSRTPGQRGGPIGPLVQRLERWLDDPQWNAPDLLDCAAIRRMATEARRVMDATETCFVHGDLIPGNLLVGSGRLTAILDWGGAGYGDPAQDLAPAWSVLPTPARRRFREIIEVDDADWIRGRAIELEHAVGGVLYYVPRQHVLGDIMAATLDRILSDS